MVYTHLSQEERDRLAVLRSQGETLEAIGRVLGRHPGTLSRELQRNRTGQQRGYYPHAAHKKAQERRRLAYPEERLKSAALRQAVEERLSQRWSPQLIAGYLKRHRPDLPTITHEAIYQWIYAQRRDLIRWLARAHPQRRYPRRCRLKNRVRIPGRQCVSERPELASRREQAGHWETDQIVGAGAMALQVTVERQSRKADLRKVATKSAACSRAALTGFFQQVPPVLRRSITYDNGAENTEHQVLNEDFGMTSYFCEPYHSWEKGTVENTNGLIRWFFPKGTRWEEIPDDAIAEVEAWLNNRPRKVLGYQSPNEVYQAISCASG